MAYMNGLIHVIYERIDTCSGFTEQYVL